MLRRTSVYIDPRYICRFRPCYRYSANSQAVQRSETQEFADTIAAVIVLSDRRVPRLVFFAFLLVSSTLLYIRSNKRDFFVRFSIAIGAALWRILKLISADPMKRAVWKFHLRLYNCNSSIFVEILIFRKIEISINRMITKGTIGKYNFKLKFRNRSFEPG